MKKRAFLRKKTVFFVQKTACGTHKHRGMTCIKDRKKEKFTVQKVFDLHTDVLNKMAGLSRQPGKPCVNAASLEAGGVKAACCACFIGDTTDRQTQLENVMRQ